MGMTSMEPMYFSLSMAPNRMLPVSLDMSFYGIYRLVPSLRPFFWGRGTPPPPKKKKVIKT